MRIVLVSRYRLGVVRVLRIEVPYQPAGDDVVGANHPGRVAVVITVIHDRAADHDQFAGNQWRGGLHQRVRADRAHVDAQVDHPAAAEVAAQVAGVSIKRYQPGICSRGDDAFGTLSRLLWLTRRAGGR